MVLTGGLTAGFDGWFSRTVLAVLVGLTASAAAQPRFQLAEGAIVRGPTDARRIALVFTGHEFGESAPVVLDVLARHGAKASFFFTGAFLRNPAFAPVVRRAVAEGHYVGGHSDAHLLYAPWSGPKVTLVSRAEFVRDLERNYEALAAFGVTRRDAPYFLPPYEWYTGEIALWTREIGLTLISHTPGTRSNADYTEEGSPQFVSSRSILDSILRREREDPHGLNGFLLLLHAGAGPRRTDKFHLLFDRLLRVLSEREYGLVRVDELLEPAWAPVVVDVAGARRARPAAPSGRAVSRPDLDPVIFRHVAF